MSKRFLAIFGGILIIGFLLFTMLQVVLAAPVTFPLKSGHADQLQPAATIRRFQPAATINEIQN